MSYSWVAPTSVTVVSVLRPFSSHAPAVYASQWRIQGACLRCTCTPLVTRACTRYCAHSGVGSGVTTENRSKGSQNFSPFGAILFIYWWFILINRFTWSAIKMLQNFESFNEQCPWVVETKGSAWLSWWKVSFILWGHDWVINWLSYHAGTELQMANGRTACCGETVSPTRGRLSSAYRGRACTTAAPSSSYMVTAGARTCLKLVHLLKLVLIHMN